MILFIKGYGYISLHAGSDDFFQIKFFKTIFQEHYQSASLDPNQVGPDLGLNCLQRLPAITSPRKQGNRYIGQSMRY